MIRLSKRAMNNVVIYAMLLMVFMFNIDKFLPTSPNTELVPLLPSDAYILKIETENRKLERVGQIWRVVNPSIDNNLTPEEKISAWRLTKISPLNEANDANLHNEDKALQVIVVWLAGEPKGRVFVCQANGPTKIKYNNTWFKLHGATVDELLP